MITATKEPCRAGGAATVFALVLLGTLALADPAGAGSTVKVDLWDKPEGAQGMTLSTAEVPAGEVNFEITNSSKVREHEFLFVKTDLEPDQIPLKDEGKKVDEDALDGVAEFGDLEEGDTKSWTVEMTPGAYVLFCNEEGHFKAGMWAKFTVTP